MPLFLSIGIDQTIIYNVKEIYHRIIILNKLKCLTVCFKVN